MNSKEQSEPTKTTYTYSTQHGLFLYGAIIGDIVGSKYEFNNIKRKDFPLFSPGCTYTDDSIMTIAVANALHKSKGKKDEFTSSLVEEMQFFGRRYPFPKGGYGRKFRAWLQQDDPQPYNSLGNGSAMRVSACGIFAVTLEEALELAEISASVTHNHPEGIKGAKAVAAAIFLAKNGKTKDEIKSYIEQHFYTLDKSIDEVRKTYFYNETCQGTVPQSIIAFLDSENFEDAVRNAVSIGGDTDTVAAITSSIAWVYYLTLYMSAHHYIMKSQWDEILPQEFIDISLINNYLPQEFIDIIDLFGKLAEAKATQYDRLTNDDEFSLRQI